MLHVLSFEQRGMVQVLVAGLLALVVSVTGLALLAIAQAVRYRPSTAATSRGSSSSRTTR